MSKFEVTPAQKTEIKKYELGIDYSNAVLERLGGVTIVAATGPSAVGVTTTIRESGLDKVRGFTNRSQRNDADNAIRFIPQTAAAVDDCIDKAKRGDLVQIKLSEEGYLYGSEPEDYFPDKLNVVDMATSSIIGLTALPIKELIPVVFVCEPAELCERFLAHRGPFEENRDRLWNDSVNLEQTVLVPGGDEDMFFRVIVNHKGQLDETVSQFLEVARGEHYGDHEDASDIRDRLVSELAFLATI